MYSQILNNYVHPMIQQAIFMITLVDIMKSNRKIEC